MTERMRWLLASILSLGMLMAPALWNGFPLLQYDTGGYLARWYEGILVPSRAVVYGLILNAGTWPDFWPVVIVQSALTLWVLALLLRTHGLGRRPWLFAAVVLVLSLISTLPWLTAILLTDIFCGLGVLALYMLVRRADALSRREQIGLGVLVAVAAATHSATLAVLMALAAAALVWHFIDRVRVPFAAVLNGILALTFGAGLVLAADFAVTGRLAWTPGGFALSFGRMLQDGIVTRYLDEHCPDSHLRLCAHRSELPDDADVWFWGSPLFDQLGRFAGLGKEMETIALGSLAAYPALQARTAVIATAKQLIDVHTGEGVLNAIWHTYSILEKFVPGAVPAMRAARQQKGEIGFTAINWVQWPVGLLAMLLLPVIVIAARGARFAPVRELAATVATAVLANAAVCGALSNPHDRYGARIVWLAVLVVIMAAAIAALPSDNSAAETLGET
jgi:hypothetical protein